jgi:hypothetical protein
MSSLDYSYENHDTNIYENMPHKRLEFWHKNLFVHHLDVEKINIKMRGETEKIYAFGSQYKKWKKNYYSPEGGECFIFLPKSPTYWNIIQNVKENLEFSFSNYKPLDAILRNKKTNNMVQLNVVSHVRPEKETENHCVFSLLFLSIRLQHTPGTC